jgi:hypothetical protein
MACTGCRLGGDACSVGRWIRKTPTSGAYGYLFLLSRFIQALINTNTSKREINLNSPGFVGVVFMAEHSPKCS